jgi:non-heme chloroperoxidase
MLTEPSPPKTEPFAMGIWHYARGLAFVARNEVARGEHEADALTRLLDHDAFRTTLKDLPLLTNLQIAQRIVRGELASRAGRHDEAVRLLQEATALEDGIAYNEPPVWHQPPRQVLGALLLAAGRPAEAEAEYRKDLERFRENGWSLFGLAQSLTLQGKADEARAVRARFEKAWARADMTLSSSRIVSSTQPEASAHDANHAKESYVEKFVTLSTGVRMEYVEHGPSDGVPVVFLHGVTDSWRSFERVLPLLPPTIRAFAVSQRGHGDSSRPASGYRFTDLSDDLLAFMEAMRVPRAIIVGHSMGSSVAQRFVVDHPDRVSGVVLMGAFSNFDDPGFGEFVASSIVPLTDPIAPAFAREWQQSTLAQQMAPDHFETVVAETVKVPSRVWREAFDGFLKTADFTNELASVSVPTLLMWGDRDTYAQRAAQDRLLTAIPRAQLVTYEGFGHALHWEDPARITNDLVAFVSNASNEKKSFAQR